jgi:hypothetical protein
MNSTKPQKRLSIRDILAADAPKMEAVKSGMSEKEVADLLAPIAGLSTALLQLSFKTGEALGETLGIKSGKKVEKVFSYPYVSVVRALVLALGSLKHQITALFDTPRGCAIEAKLPTDIFSLGGSLFFEIVEEGTSQVRIIGSSEIRGQMFDWGKGKRALRGVFDKIEHYSNLLSHGA